MTLSTLLECIYGIGTHIMPANQAYSFHPQRYWLTVLAYIFVESDPAIQLKTVAVCLTWLLLTLPSIETLHQFIDLDQVFSQSSPFLNVDLNASFCVHKASISHSE